LEFEEKSKKQGERNVKFNINLISTFSFSFISLVEVFREAREKEQKTKVQESRAPRRHFQLRLVCAVWRVEEEKVELFRGKSIVL
jgi:hypothetical protein